MENADHNEVYIFDLIIWLIRVLQSQRPSCTGRCIEILYYQLYNFFNLMYMPSVYHSGPYCLYIHVYIYLGNKGAYTCNEMCMDLDIYICVCVSLFPPVVDEHTKIQIELQITCNLYTLICAGSTHNTLWSQLRTVLIVYRFSWLGHQEIAMPKPAYRDPATRPLTGWRLFRQPIRSPTRESSPTNTNSVIGHSRTYTPEICTYDSSWISLYIWYLSLYIECVKHAVRI